MMSSGNPEVLIVGGGIGGLGAALALARRRIRSRVLEKEPEFGEIGYGIQIAPNAYRLLDLLGVITEIVPTAVFPDKLVMIDATSEAMLADVDLGEAYRERYGAPYIVAHRRDIHGTMLEACKKSEFISLHTSKALVRFADNGNSVTAFCADGSEHSGCALVGADGLRSVVRELVLGDGPPRTTGHIAFRGVVPIEEVKDQAHIDSMALWVGSGMHLIQYRLRGGTVMNNVATFVSEAFKVRAPDADELARMFEQFSQSSDRAGEMLKYVNTDRHWMLYDRDPSPGWTRGNVTLLGDAAHPTLQYLAQGACLALEDAMVLAEKLGDGNADVHAALLAYEEARYLRTARAQVTARIFGEIIHCGGGARDVRNHLLQFRSRGSAAELDWVHRGIKVS